MVMTQRYPSYFDGVVSGDPAIHVGYSGLGNAWLRAAFNEAAPKDANGRPQPHLLFSDADKKLVTDGVLAACDADDGVRDGMVFNTRACDFDPASLVCSGTQDRRAACRRSRSARSRKASRVRAIHAAS